MRMIGAQTTVVVSPSSSSVGKQQHKSKNEAPLNAIHGVVLKKATTTTTHQDVPGKRRKSFSPQNNNNNDDPLAFVGAKPSDIKYASKRAQERKEAIRRREEEAQLKMQKFRDEINRIKQNQQQQGQQGQQVESVEVTTNNKEGDSDDTTMAQHGQDREEVETAEAAVEPPIPNRESMTRLDELVEAEAANKKDEQSEIEQGDREQDNNNNMEAILGMLEGSETDDESDEYESDCEDMPFDCRSKKTKDIGNRVIHEMNASFAQLSLNVDAVGESRTSFGASPLDSMTTTTTTTTTAASNEPVRRRELQATKSGRLENTGGAKQPSNLVPEMRRRATQRDLTFDGHHQVDLLGSRSNHGPVAVGSVGTPKSNKNKKSIATTDKSSDSGKLSAHSEGEEEEEEENNNVAPSLPPPPPPSPQDDVSSSANTSRFGKKEKAMKAADAAKLEEEKRQMEEQRGKIEQAKEAFQMGHDLCWKSEKPAAALQQYRKALFIRESLLGKYHEETGRSYFWIGKSLAKLKEYDEALVAYSRAMRIFDRVLMQSHKYNKWAKLAVEVVFKEIDDDRDYDTYKNGIDASIKHEKAGDGCRKRGQYEQAIAEYRAAIDNIQEYHPDAADLYCKIAIIMRQQGEFEHALEEYKFASEIYELSLGAEHPETVKTLNQLYEKKRSNQVALALMEKLKMRS